ncbi:MAG: site-specific DNA-methyltransferase [Solirubrobacterales bacterium]
MTEILQEPTAVDGRFGEHDGRENLLVLGDCLQVLSTLDEHTLDTANVRTANVRLAYLDPPFNTGERSRDFEDSFDRSDWLDFMQERLQAVWSTLRPDGSVWVHCDDREQAALRVLMDGIFGRERHVATIVWQRRYSRENRLAFSRSHDYLHVFAPAGGQWKEHRNRLARNDKPGTWQNPDNDARGQWSTVSLVAQGGHGTKSQSYSIELPSGRVVSPPKGSCWRVNKARFDALVCENLIWFGPTGNNVPRRKVFLDEAQGLVPSTWWTHAEVGHNAEANAEARRLFPQEPPFSTPKPERLMLRIIELSSNAGDLVLDPFAGSATTLAVAHKSGRSWLGIEASAQTIKRFAEPRLRAVIDGRDSGGVSELLEWHGGGSFGLVSDPPMVGALSS